MSPSESPRTARVLKAGTPAGTLAQHTDGTFSFTYDDSYGGPPVSLGLPVRAEPYFWPQFPPFFDGLLPEGVQLDALLRTLKLDRHAYFDQLVAVGGDLVGDVTVEAGP